MGNTLKRRSRTQESPSPERSTNNIGTEPPNQGNITSTNNNNDFRETSGGKVLGSLLTEPSQMSMKSVASDH